MDNNDIELFSTTDFKAKDQIVSILVRHRVSYLERWEKVPLLKRREYGGAKELCVIYVNGNQYGKAKKLLDDFNESYAEVKREKRRKRKAAAAASKDVGEADKVQQEEPVGDTVKYTADNDIDDGIDEI